jgi:hypothetical protein
MTEEFLDEISIYIFWCICGGLVGFMMGLNFVGFDIDATYVAEARRALTKAGANA